ncbi:MAG: hypothetical protein IAC58_04270 [Firmicutes bacterium]|uniref:Uncharacterized protein n=1 Tax=Candidatus Onthovivens merdipullorum TaxID=2840889 RepID=A0A9D9DIZ8_9BACL|nr:hypothetical protein [Candidatus Onthovivens merdipullorum]
MNVSIFFFVTVIFLTLFNGFNIGIKGNYISRTFIDLPVSLIKSCVLVNEESYDENSSYFDKNKLEENVKEYLTINLKEHVESYNLSFYYFYYDENLDLIYDLGNYPKNVQIHFNADIYKNIDIDKYLVFTMEDLF